MTINAALIELPILLLFLPMQVGGNAAVKIKLAKSRYSLAERVSVEVVYENTKDTGLKIENPAKSFDVEMHVVDTQSKEDHSYTMGVMGVTVDSSGDRRALIQPPKEEVEIAPGASLHFASDLSDRLYLRPGVFDCFLTDNGMESNHLPLTIVFDKAAVDGLLAVAQDPRQSYGRREWAMEWLKKVRKDFVLDLPLDEDAPEARAKKEAANKPLIEKFSRWWQEAAKSAKTDEILEGARR